MTINDPNYYSVVVMNGDTATLDTASEAMDYAARRVYLHHTRQDEVLADLLAGRRAAWAYGFSEVSITQMRRRVAE